MGGNDGGLLGLRHRRRKPDRPGLQQLGQSGALPLMTGQRRRHRLHPTEHIHLRRPGLAIALRRRLIQREHVAQALHRAAHQPGKPAIPAPHKAWLAAIDHHGRNAARLRLEQQRRADFPIRQHNGIGPPVPQKRPHIGRLIGRRWHQPRLARARHQRRNPILIGQLVGQMRQALQRPFPWGMQPNQPTLRARRKRTLPHRLAASGQVVKAPSKRKGHGSAGHAPSSSVVEPDDASSRSR